MDSGYLILNAAFVVTDFEIDLKYSKSTSIPLFNSPHLIHRSKSRRWGRSLVMAYTDPGFDLEIF